MALRRLLLVAALLTSCSVTSLSHASGPSVVVMAEPSIDGATRRRVERVVASRRALRKLRPLPTAQAVAPAEVANAGRVQAVALALDRARQRASEAAWEECAREAAEALGQAIEVLAHARRLDLLRDLHIQIGVCMTLGQHSANARPHFQTAALLDETPPQPGRYREEAEHAMGQIRDEVLARSRGPVRIVTDPPGAEVWLDGRKAAGVTPLDVSTRLGDHFVTIRRFRFEQLTERRVLQPGSRVRFELEPARRSSLKRQLAAVAAGQRRAAPHELRWARARWSHAAQLLWLSRTGYPSGAAEPSTGRAPGPLAPRQEALATGGTGVRLALVDVATGQTLRTRSVATPADDADWRMAVCGVLGETCEPPDEGIPWYVWPIAGAALVGAAIATGFIIDSARPTRFCPSTGCD